MQRDKMGEVTMTARCASEFIGTFVLVITVCGNVLSNQHFYGGVSIACALCVMVFALAKSSGAHFNPSVTVALFAAGKFPMMDVPYYLISQFAGGLSAAILTMALYLGETVPVAPVGGHFWWQAALAELFYTLVLVVVGSACTPRSLGPL